MLHRNASMSGSQRGAGYTLIELLLVISLMGIFAALLLPRFEPSVHDQLEGLASIISADMSYARNLAVTNGSKYTLTFSRTNNAYTLQHTGANNLLDVLPSTPYRHNASSPDAQLTYLADLPHLGPEVQLHGVQVGSGSISASGALEFNDLGGVEGGQSFTLWLVAGADDAQRFQSLTVAPVTGLVSIGEFRAAPP